MKKLLKNMYLVIVAIFIISIVPVSKVYAAATESEPNNSLSSANSINIGPSYTGNLSTLNDIDCYKVVVPTDGELTVNLNHAEIPGDSMQHWTVELIDSSNNSYMSMDVKGYDSDTNMKKGLAKGTYYIKVICYCTWASGYYSPIDYNISAALTSSDYFEKESNGSMPIASNMEINKKYTGALNSSDDIDFYKVVLPSDGEVTVKFNHQEKAGDSIKHWVVALLDGKNTEYVNFDVQGNNAQTSKSISLPQGTYYVRVKCYCTWAEGYYSSMDYNVTAQYINVFSGSNRYATAAETSKASYTTADTVILATGINFPDALSAGPLAFQENAPILLTATNSLPLETLDEITRLKATKVIIMGGLGVVGPAVVSTLNSLGINVERVNGSNRYMTAVETAKRVRAKSGVTDKVILANGYGFADALSIGSYASKNGIPILLTNSTALSAETKAALQAFGIKQVQIIGGYTAISQGIDDELKTMQITVTRTSGSSRFGTSAEVAGKFFSGSQKVVVANGRGFADALAAVPLAAKLNAPIILVEQGSLPTEVSAYLNSCKINSVTVVGGDSAVGQIVRDKFTSAIDTTPTQKLFLTAPVTNLYKTASFDNPMGTSSLGGQQAVTIVCQNGDWYCVKTWLGNAWINIKSPTGL